MRDGCTLEVSHVLLAGGLVPPLYLHSSLHTTPRGRLSESGPEMEWEHRMAQVSRNQVRAALALARPCTFCSSEA